MDAVLKQRLIGAAVIWVLALIFLPMMLEKPRQSSQATPTRLSLPNMPEERREVRSLDLVEKPAPAPEQKSKASAQEAHKPSTASQSTNTRPQVQETAAVAHNQPVQTPQPVAHQADKAKAVVPPIKSTAAPAGKWVIQVGSFSDKANAESLAKRVRARDYPVMISKFELGNRSLYRVQVGPVRDRANADEKLAKLQGQLGLNGKVVALP
jgi:DedD protein